MKKIICILVVGIAALGVFELQGTRRIYAQEISQSTREGLTTLRDKSLRLSDPQRVTKAIEEVTAPYRARPANSTDLIPTDVIGALVDLLDFEGSESKNFEFNMSAGQKVYPVMNALRFMRKPVLPAVVKVLENEDFSSDKSKNALEVIRNILGRDDATTVDYLSVETTLSNTEEGKANLWRAISAIKNEHKCDNLQ